MGVAASMQCRGATTWQCGAGQGLSLCSRPGAGLCNQLWRPSSPDALWPGRAGHCPSHLAAAGSCCGWLVQDPGSAHPRDNKSRGCEEDGPGPGKCPYGLVCLCAAGAAGRGGRCSHILLTAMYYVLLAEPQFLRPGLSPRQWQAGVERVAEQMLFSWSWTLPEAPWWFPYLCIALCWVAAGQVAPGHEAS